MKSWTDWFWEPYAKDGGNFDVDQGGWVILRHSDYVNELERYRDEPEKFPFGPIIYHTETYNRFRQSPPQNPKWEHYWDVPNLSAALYAIKRFLQFDIDEYCYQSITVSKEVTLSSRYDILKRDGYKCQICGRDASDGVKLEVDHKVPKSKGGADDQENLWTLCFDCNRGKSDKPM